MRPTTTYSALLGSVVLAYRRDRRVTQTEVASKLGLSQSGYCRLERGETSLTVEQLRSLADAFSVPLSALVDAAERGVLALRKRGIEVLTDCSFGSIEKVAWVSGGNLAQLVAPAVLQVPRLGSKKKTSRLKN